MTEKYKEAKLIYMDTDHKDKLLEIKEEVSKTGGDVSLNQLIRDAIELLVECHKNEIIEYHRPKRLKELIRSDLNE